MLSASSNFRSALSYWRAKANPQPEFSYQKRLVSRPVTITRLQNLFVERERTMSEKSSTTSWTMKKAVMLVNEEKNPEITTECQCANGHFPTLMVENRSIEHGEPCVGMHTCHSTHANDNNTVHNSGHETKDNNGFGDNAKISPQHQAKNYPNIIGQDEGKGAGHRGARCPNGEKITDVQHKENQELPHVGKYPLSPECKDAIYCAFQYFTSEKANKQNPTQISSCTEGKPRHDRCMATGYSACQCPIAQEISLQTPLSKEVDDLQENHTISECAEADVCQVEHHQQAKLASDKKNECQLFERDRVTKELLVSENDQEAFADLHPSVTAVELAHASANGQRELFLDEEEIGKRKLESQQKAKEIDKLFETYASTCICLVCGGDDVQPPDGYESWKEWSDDEMPECICLVCCPKEIPIPAGYESWEEWGAFETDCWCLVCGPWKPSYKPKWTDQEREEVTKMLIEARDAQLKHQAQRLKRDTEEFWRGYKAHCAQFKHLRLKNYFRKFRGKEPIVHWQPCQCHRLKFFLKQEKKYRKEQKAKANARATGKELK